MDMTVRPALHHEVSTLIELWQAIDAFPDAPRPFGGDSADKPEQARQLIAHGIDSDNALVLVAVTEDDSRIIGTISGHVFNKPAVNVSSVGVIYSLWVEGAYRKQGVGKQLLADLERQLKEKGAQALQVGWDVVNHSAALWWQQRGYAPYEVIASKLL